MNYVINNLDGSSKKDHLQIVNHCSGLDKKIKNFNFTQYDIK